MEKKDFLKLTEKLLLNYGFVKIGKTFFLDLDRAVIALRKRVIHFMPEDTFIIIIYVLKTFMKTIRLIIKRTIKICRRI